MKPIILTNLCTALVATCAFLLGRTFGEMSEIIDARFNARRLNP